MAGQSTRWVRTVVDYAAPVAFLGTLLITHDFQKATWVLVGASFLALGLGWAVERRLAPLPLFAGVTALVFGGLTLVFHDPRFVKMKLTFVDTSLGVALLGGLVIGKTPLKSLLGEALHLPNAAWKVLTVRYGIFFLACAIANELVWRTQSDARWAMFWLPVMGAALLFSLAQTPFLMKHMTQPADEPIAPEPPDPGF